MSEIEGIIDLHVELNEEIPQVQVKVNLEAAKKYGLKPGAIRWAATTLVAGEEVGDIFRGGKAYDVNVWSTPETINSLTDIQNELCLCAFLYCQLFFFRSIRQSEWNHCWNHCTWCVSLLSLYDAVSNHLKGAHMTTLVYLIGIFYLLRKQNNSQLIKWLVSFK